METFEFDYMLAPQNALDVDEVGEFAIEAVDVDGFCYYLSVRTFVGISVVTTWGPVIPDVKVLPAGFKVSVDKIKFDAKKLHNIVERFLNDSKKGIKDATAIPVVDIPNLLPDIKGYLTALSAESF